jgi:hypothetical protein
MLFHSSHNLFETIEPPILKSHNICHSCSYQHQIKYLIQLVVYFVLVQVTAQQTADHKFYFLFRRGSHEPKFHLGLFYWAQSPNLSPWPKLVIIISLNSWCESISRALHRSWIQLEKRRKPDRWIKKNTRCTDRRSPSTALTSTWIHRRTTPSRYKAFVFPSLLNPNPSCYLFADLGFLVS